MHRTASATRQSRLVQKAKAESRSCWNRHQLRARRSHLQNAKGSGRQAGSRNPAATRPRSLVSGMSHRTHAVGENSESTGMSSSNCHPVIPRSPGPLGQAVRTDTHPPDIPPEVPLSPPRAPAHPALAGRGAVSRAFWRRSTAAVSTNPLSVLWVTEKERVRTRSSATEAII